MERRTRPVPETSWKRGQGFYSGGVFGQLHRSMAVRYKPPSRTYNSGIPGIAAPPDMHAVHLLVVVILASVSTISLVAAQDLLNLARFLRPSSTSQADYSRDAQNTYRSSLENLAQSLAPQSSRSSSQTGGINNFRDFISELNARNQQQQPFQQQLLTGTRNFEQFVRTLFGQQAPVQQLTTSAPVDVTEGKIALGSLAPSSATVRV